MADKLKRYKLNRQICINDMLSLVTLANTAKQDKSKLTMFKVRYADIESISDEFNKHHQNILSILLQDQTFTDFTEDNTLREEFLDEYYQAKTIYVELFESNPPFSQAAGISSEQLFTTSRVRLPQLDLPKFSGDIREFNAFIDMFNSAVHTNETLSSIDKFKYLVASLEGNAHSLIKYLPITEKNYVIAYNALTERYCNKRICTMAHWSEIENSRKINGDNFQALQKLLNTFTENLAALETFDLPVKSWDFILVNMLLQRLDNDTVKRFELEHGSNEIPQFEELKAFISRQCSVLETIGCKNKTKFSEDTSRSPSTRTSHNKRVSCVAQTTLNKCALCHNNHHLNQCPQFLEKTPFDRFNFCKRIHCCFNCLSNYHDVKKCKSSTTCRKCGQLHHTLLHFSKTSTSNSNIASSSSASVNNDSVLLNQANPSPAMVSTVGLSNVENISTVLLSTIQVEVLDNFGNFQKIRGLLDTGSMSSFITQKSVSCLGLRKSKQTLNIHGIGCVNSKVSQGSVTLTLRPVGRTNPILHINATVLPKICNNIPISPVVSKSWPHITNISLADPQFDSPGAIDILLDANVFSQILLNGRIAGELDEPVAINTSFGYVLMGKIGGTLSPATLPTISALFCSSTECSDLDTTLKQFWEVESVPEKVCVSAEDVLCEEIFQKHCFRNKEGRFVVPLPFKDENLPIFPESRAIALQRFYSLERRLLRNKPLYEEYCKFMKEYWDLGHMELVSSDNITPHSFYIPHFSVIRPEAVSTKLRVVFDASVKQANQLSLNHHLLVGPKLQRDLVTILLNFRIHAVVLTADIRQMYRQILVDPRFSDYQRIVWRFSPQEHIQDFRLLTVTYGTSVAPYLSLRTILELVKKEGGQFPSAAHALTHDTYIDDVVTGCSSIEDAKILKKELISLLSKGCFELRKWSSNEPSVLSDLPESHLCQKPLFFEQDPADSFQKILGLQWNPFSDYFSFAIQTLDRPCTKRTMLSELARVFDPLGMLAPITLFIKHLIQRLWSQGLSWDSTPSVDIVRIWSQYKSELHLLSKLQIPRILLWQQCDSVELHGFCDASSIASAAVVYFRCIQNGVSRFYFVCAKTKVAPLKNITIPRLELNAAVLLTKLITYILNVYEGKITFRSVFAYSDSQIVLTWIRSSAHRWKTFVSNRVAFIQEKIAPSSWSYVRSKQNPADIASRGSTPAELLDASYWFQGPSFLLDPNYQVIQNTQKFDIPQCDMSVASLEERKVVLVNVTDEKHLLDELMDHFSSFSVLQRIVAYLWRFYHNARLAPNDKRLGYLSARELYNATLILVKRTQQIYFSEEFEKENILSKPLRKLNAFFDDCKVIRVGGRLKNSNLPFDSKHPILLPRQCRLTYLLIEFYHRKYFHAGLRTVQYLLFQQFWILSPKRAIRSVLSKCLICWKQQPKAMQPYMGNLPSCRISQVKPFVHTGVDFGGPFFVTMNRYRGAKSCKVYLCLFICMSTKALHLELATDLSSETFLAALQRFIARRGRVSDMYSDRGTNFTGANTFLCKIMEKAAGHEGINWSFNPPSGPHFGGLWEAGIKSVKTHLARVVGDQILSYEELYTVIAQIEAFLNSRPLTPMSQDPNDLSVLTPGHFLTMEPLSSMVPESDSGPYIIPKIARWNLLQRIQRHFWDRWYKEYLHTLQQRGKWFSHDRSIEEGALVLIKEDLLPPMQWRLGRITRLYTGTDGICRVAEVLTKNGTLKRPLVKLCPLPVS